MYRSDRFLKRCRSIRVIVDDTSGRVLGVFAKWPSPGLVKTRLAREGDPTWSARVARAFLLDTVERLSSVSARRVLVFAPREREDDFTDTASGRFALRPQRGGDLGERLASFLQEEVDGGARAVVVVGTDSPTLPVEYVEQAYVALERADVVLGPAVDGGYYLVGCGPSRPPIFEGIAWGTGTVLAETIAALADPRWRLALLAPWYDVDTPADWTMLVGHVSALRRAGNDPVVPHTEALIREATSAR
jgi:rSAM/selenodomain-associated transferase 1